MTDFTVRVELHNAEWADYITLHDKMAKEGFTRTIKDDKSGIYYQLPTAEYNIISTLTMHQILNKADAAASLVVKSHATLVTESAGRTWTNLSRA